MVKSYVWLKLAISSSFQNESCSVKHIPSSPERFACRISSSGLRSLSSECGIVCAWMSMSIYYGSFTCVQEMFRKFSTFFFKQLRENILHCPLPLCYIIVQRRKRGDRRLLADYGYIAILTVVAISIPALILFLAKAL